MLIHVWNVASQAFITLNQALEIYHFSPALQVFPDPIDIIIPTIASHELLPIPVGILSMLIQNGMNPPNIPIPTHTVLHALCTRRGCVLIALSL